MFAVRMWAVVAALCAVACGSPPDPGEPSDPVGPVVSIAPIPLYAEPFSVLQLDATATYDPDNDDRTTMTFVWNLIEAPEGSNVKPIADKPDKARMLADRIGLFVIELCVTDADGLSDCTTVQFTCAYYPHRLRYPTTPPPF